MGASIVGTEVRVTGSETIDSLFSSSANAASGNEFKKEVLARLEDIKKENKKDFNRLFDKIVELKQ